MIFKIDCKPQFSQDQNKAGVAKKITLDTHKALIKYFEIKVKAGSSIDIKKVVDIMKSISKIKDFDLNSDVVFQELQIFDKTSNGDDRRELLNLVKDTIIKYLYIPNTTYTEITNDLIVLNRVYHLKLMYNFMKPDITLPACTFTVFPNLRVLDIEQILLSASSCQMLINYVTIVGMLLNCPFLNL